MKDTEDHGYLSLGDFEACVQDAIAVSKSEVSMIADRAGAVKVYYKEFFRWLDELEEEIDDTDVPSAAFVRRWNAASKACNSPRRGKKGRPALLRKGSCIVQAAGHQSSMTKDKDTSEFILKPLDKTEVAAYEHLWSKSSVEEPLQKFSCDYGGTISIANTPGAPPEEFLRISNLLQDFAFPNVMDCKIGVRSFEEKECVEKKLREDLYFKMLKKGPAELTDAEHEAKAITKFRWMNFRDCSSSSRNLGFRIDGITSRKGALIDAAELPTIRSFERVCTEIKKVRGGVPA
jgi:hypothetical protein